MVATNNDLFRRANNQDRGRHLVAACHLEKGRLILAERPLLAQQSLENICHNLICHGCKSFLGGGGFNNILRDPTVSIVPCRHSCGHVFCSEACERDTYALHHKYLCTGPATTVEDPVVQFKQFCVETNEILLLVAEWWISQHTTPGDTTPYTDFCMHPWWDVVAQGLSPAERETMDMDGLEQQLRSTCDTAAELLNQVLTSNDHDDVPPISAWDISIRIGSCEQNAMGVRQRSPWCRMVFDREFRKKNISQLISNLQEAGFLEEEEDQENDACVESTCSSQPSGATVQESNSENEADTRMDELSSLIVDLRIDEDGSVRDLAVPAEQQVVDCIGDDLDLIFTPLDGTAMFSIACKMNHSCDPNVMVVYRRQPGWGQRYPLAAFCIALRDISEHEELTISYIDSNEPFEERSQALRNYGFECNCRRCEVDRLGTTVEDDQETDGTTDIFGDDSDSDSTSPCSIEETIEATAEGRLQDRLNRLDSAVNLSRFGWIPMHAHGSVCSFVLRSQKSILSEDAKLICDDPIPRLLGSCSDALQGRDYCLAKIVGLDLEAHLMSILKRSGKWEHPLFRNSYWCASLTFSMGLAHDYDFASAQHHLDKAIALGLPIQQVEAFIHYVAHFSSFIHRGPLYPAFQPCQLIPDYRDDDLLSMVHSIGLSSPIRSQVQEQSELSGDIPSSKYFRTSESVVLRQHASEWPAVEKWRDLTYLARLMGHRVVPIEVGSMQKSSMKESFISFREFIDLYLVSSTQRTVWSLEDCKASPDIAYLAQHPLLSQVPALEQDFLNIHNLCGSAGPSRANAWIGTGGTQTPLHFDTYDNLLVQLVGAKYVRLYSATATEELYVSKSSSYGAQGNMSSLRCEDEDFVQHPKAKDARYTETVLYPGDVLFIPSGMWHYVRSLSTSISINFWF